MEENKGPTEPVPVPADEPEDVLDDNFFHYG